MTGSGTVGDPFIIEDVDDLQAIQDDLTAYYELGGDIDASATSGWNAGAGFIPISYFQGNFDGKGFTITGLFIDKSGTAGLFNQIDTTLNIKDVTLASVDITGTSAVGALAYIIWDGIVSGCHVSGTVTGGNNTGGLFGEYQADSPSTVSDCSSSVVVAGGTQTGGLIGALANASGTITGCSATGSVSGSARVGGFVGRHLSGGASSTITQCYATGNVTTTSGSVGGFVGQMDGNATGGIITQSYADGNVLSTGGEDIGGFVGYFQYVDSTHKIQDCYCRGNVSGVDDVGGFAGETDGDITGGNIDNCYSTGTVTASGSGEGGFCATRFAPKDDITNCFWDTESSGEATSDGGTGKTTDQMQTEATFTDAGWDFSTIWLMAGYPTLLAFAVLVPSGYLWQEGPFIYFGTEDGFRGRYNPPLTVSGSEDPGYLWTEGTELNVIDSAGDERAEEGTATGDTGPEGTAFIEGSELHYLDETAGAERTH
ncbi:hypothetical protein LCGC14_1421380 [marine sediment metagenome]|uniref:GLUG domain-containing protein n=1 Tax=marine sediment metagenome TaxID=412755 RepID=A0A0F9JR38_9ZZZZ